MIRWFVPGRIEVFGKHTDYAGGHSLLAAIDRGVTVALEDADEFTAATEAYPDERIRLVPGTPLDAPAGHWGHYVQVVLDRLSSNFGELRPAKLEISSTLPLASGMSSSSAMVVATMLAVAEHNGLTDTEAWRANIGDDLELAHYAACVENGYDYKALVGSRGVGTLGGSEDHTAMICCRDGELTEFSFIPTVRHGSAPLPAGWGFVVGVSGVRAEKSGAVKDQYNYLSASTKELVERWQAATGREERTLMEILAQEDGLEGLTAIVADDEPLTRRLQAFANEVLDYIPRAVAALASGDVEAFGAAASDSHANADARLRNQIPETNGLVRIARELGSPAASASGAGFGGSVWALVMEDEAERFAEQWHERYVAEFPDTTPEFILTRPSSPARPA